jgi:hypothetical protein
MKTLTSQTSTVVGNVHSFNMLRNNQRVRPQIHLQTCINLVGPKGHLSGSLLKSSIRSPNAPHTVVSANHTAQEFVSKVDHADAMCGHNGAGWPGGRPSSADRRYRESRGSLPLASLLMLGQDGEVHYRWLLGP